MGAEKVAHAIKIAWSASASSTLEIVRNGLAGCSGWSRWWKSRLRRAGWLTDRLQSDAVPGLFDGGFWKGSRIRCASGLTEEIPYFKRQERLTFARCGVTDPLSLSDYMAHGGFAGWSGRSTMTPAAIVEEVIDSGLRGRGGAGFPTGIKWRTVLQRRPSRNISSAMRTKATAVLMRIA